MRMLQILKKNIRASKPIFLQKSKGQFSKLSTKTMSFSTETKDNKGTSESKALIIIDNSSSKDSLMTADDNNPSIWGAIKKSFLNSISVPLETQKYRRTLSKISSVEEYEFSKSTGKVKENKMEEFKQKFDEVLKEKQGAFDTEIEEIAKKRRTSLSTEFESDAKIEFGKFEGNLNVVSKNKLDDFSKDIDKEIKEKKIDYQKSIDNTAQEEVKKFFEDIRQATIPQQDLFEKSLLVMAEEKQIQFSERIEQEKKEEQKKFKEGILETSKKIAETFSVEFNQSIQPIAKDQKAEFMIEIGKDSEKGIKDFSKCIDAEAEKKEVLFAEAIDKEACNQTDKLISKVGDYEQVAQRNISSFSEKEKDSLINKLRDSNASEIKDYEEKLKEKKKEVNVLIATVEEGARGILLRNILYTFFVPALFFSMVWGADKCHGIRLRKNALDALDYALELDSREAFLGTKDQIEKLVEKFNEEETRWAQLIPQIMKIKLLFLAFVNSKVAAQTNFWVAQLLLLDGEPELASYMLDQIEPESSILSDVSIFLLRGLVHASKGSKNNLESFKKARECFDKAQSLKSDKVMEARIYIARARLLKKMGNVDEAIKLLERFLKENSSNQLTTTECSLRRIILRDLAVLKMKPDVGPDLYEDLKKLFSEARKGHPTQEDLISKQCKIGLQIAKLRCFPNEPGLIGGSKEMIELYKNDFSVINYLELLSAEIGEKRLDFGKIRISTDYEYALISNIAYADQKNFKDRFSLLTDKNSRWEILDSSNVYHELGSIDFKAYAFYDNLAKELVIAYRGTIFNLQNIYTDVMIGLFNSREKIFSQAEDFLKKVQNQLEVKGEKNVKLILTGHSLGGWLAEYTTWEILRKKKQGPNRSFDLFPYVEAVTFDCPGTGNLINQTERNIPWHKAERYHLPITSYVSTPNLFNTLGFHPGTVIELPHIRLKPKHAFYLDYFWSIYYIGYYIMSGFKYNSVEIYIDKQLYFLSKQLLQLSDTHSLKLFIEEFDPKTGKLKNIPREVQKWPLGITEHGHYLKLEEKALANNISVGDMKGNLEYRHHLKHRANYETNELDLYMAKKQQIPDKVWHYLVEYQRTHGENRHPPAERRVMRYEITGEVIISTSGFTIRELIRYIEKYLYQSEPREIDSQSFFNKIKTNARLKQLSAEKLQYEAFSL